MNELTFNDIVIGERGKFLCLTDMWRATGSDPSKRPVEWLRQDATRVFISFVADELKVGQDHLFKTEQGRNGSTWAHWQPGMAYAKYLSPEFHAWCNKVVRAHMEGHSLPTLHINPVSDELFSQIIETQLYQGKEMRWVKGALSEISEAVKDLLDKGRQEPTAETMRIHAKVIRHFYFGRCPFDEEVRIVDGDGDWIVGNDGKRVMDIHHQYNRNNGALEATIPLSRKAHRLVERDLTARKKLDDVFDKYRDNVARMMAQQKQLDLKF